MSDVTPTRVKLKIAGQEFVLRANERDLDRLKQVAADVDKRIQDLQKAGIGSTQRAATMAAFQIAYDDAPAKKGGRPKADSGGDFRERVDSMIAQIDQVLR